MIEDLKPYSEYKDSELPWLGQVPSHWSISRIKSVLCERDLRSTDGKGTLLSLTRVRGLIPHRDMTDKMHSAKTLTGYKTYRPGQIVMNRMQAWSGMFGAGKLDGLVSPDYAVFDVLGGHTVKLILERLKSPDLVSQFALESKGIGSGFNRLYTDRFGSIAISLPPASEQAAIARFLAWATNRLDRAIGAKRKIIALLNEQKQAIIHRAVTRGLDPSVPLKNSGVLWLGEIPEHWEVMPVKRTCSLVRDGTHLPPARTPTGFPLLSVRNMVGGRLIRRPDDSFISKADFDKLNSSFAMYTNDVLMAVVGATLGKVAVVKDIGPFQIQRSVSVLRPRPELMSHTFLAAFLRSPRLQQHLWQSVAYSAQPGIYLGFVANIPVPVPPTIHEQVAICDSLRREQSPIDTAISRLEREIELLHEYRTRLIADVVTGKLDVREVAARLPEPHNAFDEQLEPEEEEPEFEAEDAQKESAD